MVQSTLSAFAHFPSLPTELRYQIWEAALGPSPSLYVLWFPSDSLDSRSHDAPLLPTLETRGVNKQLETLLATCRESRAIGLKAAPDIFEFRKKSTNSATGDVGHVSGMMRYNQARDILLFQVYTDTRFEGLYDQGTAPLTYLARTGAEQNPLSAVTRLAVDSIFFHREYGLVKYFGPRIPPEGSRNTVPERDALLYLIRSFPYLRQLYIRVQDYYNDLMTTLGCLCPGQPHGRETYTLRDPDPPDRGQVETYVAYDMRTDCLMYPRIPIADGPREFPYHLEETGVEVKLLLPIGTNVWDEADF